jgi:Tat protein translocase TatB subunit
MFGIGGQELFLILLLALIVLGPKKLPEIAKSLGKALGDFQRATDGLKKEFDQASDLSSPPPVQEQEEEPESEENEQEPDEEEPDKKPSQDSSTYNPDEIEG